MVRHDTILSHTYLQRQLPVGCSEFQQDIIPLWGGENTSNQGVGAPKSFSTPNDHSKLLKLFTDVFEDTNTLVTC
jgi:hypothetical protein